MNPLKILLVSSQTPRLVWDSEPVPESAETEPTGSSAPPAKRYSWGQTSEEACAVFTGQWRKIVLSEEQ